MKDSLGPLYMQWCYYNDAMVNNPGVHDPVRLAKREAIYKKMMVVCPQEEMRQNLLAEIHGELYDKRN